MKYVIGCDWTMVALNLIVLELDVHGVSNDKVRTSTGSMNKVIGGETYVNKPFQGPARGTIYSKTGGPKMACYIES